MFTRYGTDNIVVMLALSVIFIAAGYFISKSYIQIPLIIMGVLLAIFTFWFFRDPDRTIPVIALEDDSYLVSPADGKVVEIKHIEEDKYLKSAAVRISIFLSPLDVHVNRSPVSGRVEYYKYSPGQYLVAYHPKSSELNEHSLIGVSTKYGKVMFKQIVGIVARRLVCELKEGDSVRVGEKFGMMKFGSRMDIMVYPNTEINVNVGDKVVGGETIIGRLKKAEGII